NGIPEGITSGPDGNLFFTEVGGGGRSGKITTAGVITEFPATAGGYGIVTGSDGNLWIAAVNKIIKMTPAGVQTPYSLASGSSALRITNGPDGALWYVNQTKNTVGRITTAGVITETALPTSNAV